MKKLLALVALVSIASTSAFAGTRTIKLDDEAGDLLRALTDAKTMKNFKKAMAQGNRITGIIAEVNTSVRDASQVTYYVTNEHCVLGPTGDRCLGGASFQVTVTDAFIPGGHQYAYDSKVTLIK